jgi:hypothetical protein
VRWGAFSFWLTFIGDVLTVHIFVDSYILVPTIRALIVVLPISAVSPVVRCLEAAPQCAKDNSADIEDYNHD